MVRIETRYLESIGDIGGIVGYSERECLMDQQEKAYSTHVLYLVSVRLPFMASALRCTFLNKIGEVSKQRYFPPNTLHTMLLGVGDMA